MGFSDEELEAAALRYLTSDVTTPRSQSGIRDVEKTKREIYELISAAFMLRPNAFFSVCWLLSNAITGKLDEQIADLEAIVAAAPRVSRPSTKVKSVTDLHSAEASLVTLTAAFSAREAGVAGGIGPAIARFSASIDSFLRSELADNVVEDGDVVETGEELQQRIAVRWASARARHVEIEGALARFTEGLWAYRRVRLPSAVVATLLARVHARLGALITQMAQPDATAHGREALLELCTMRTLLRQAADFRPPALVKAPLTGDATKGTLVGGSGRSSSIRGAASGPFDYAPGAVLRYSLGDAPARELALPGSEAVSIDQVLAAIATEAELVGHAASVAHPAFVGQRSDAVGEEAVLRHWVASGSNLAADGGAHVRASIDAEAYGVEPAMYVVLLPSEAALRIVAVDGPLLELEAPVAEGTYTYYIGPDYRGVSPGTRMHLSGTTDFGLRRVASGTFGALTLDGPLLSAEPVRAQAIAETLELAARAPGVALTVYDTPGGQALGLVGTAPALVDRLETQVDLLARRIAPRDRLVLSRAGTTTDHVVTLVEGGTLTFTPPLGAGTGPASFVLHDADVHAYLELVQRIQELGESAALQEAAALDQAMDRLRRGARFTGEVAARVTGYLTMLKALRALLSGYVVPRDQTVEQAVRLMQEHGFDRAADLFLALRLEEFFALDADGVSYATWVVRAAAEAAREVVPVTKDTRDPSATWRTVAIQPVPRGE